MSDMYGVSNQNPPIPLNSETINTYGDNALYYFRITNIDGSFTYYYDKGNVKIELLKYLSHNKD